MEKKLPLMGYFLLSPAPKDESDLTKTSTKNLLCWAWMLIGSEYSARGKEKHYLSNHFRQRRLQTPPLCTQRAPPKTQTPAAATVAS